MRVDHSGHRATGPGLRAECSASGHLPGSYCKQFLAVSGDGGNGRGGEPKAAGAEQERVMWLVLDSSLLGRAQTRASPLPSAQVVQTQSGSAFQLLLHC